MMTTVTLQFLSTLGLFVLPVIVFRAEIFSIFPPVLMGATAVVFALAIVAFVNTLLIVQKTLSEPVSKLQETATGLGNGDTEVSLPEIDQRDELGDLADAFEEIHEYVTLSTEQATAVRNQDFDAPVLDEEVPGELGHGSGLGLFLVHWIVSQLDGDVAVPTVDGGTTIAVRIPRVQTDDGPGNPNR